MGLQVAQHHPAHRHTDAVFQTGLLALQVFHNLTHHLDKPDFLLTFCPPPRLALTDKISKPSQREPVLK